MKQEIEHKELGMGNFQGAEAEANRASFQRQSAPSPAPSADAGDGFMNIPDGIDEELPFN